MSASSRAVPLFPSFRPFLFFRCLSPSSFHREVVLLIDEANMISAAMHQTLSFELKLVNNSFSVEKSKVRLLLPFFLAISLADSFSPSLFRTCTLFLCSLVNPAAVNDFPSRATYHRSASLMWLCVSPRVAREKV